MLRMLFVCFLLSHFLVSNSGRVSSPFLFLPQKRGRRLSTIIQGYISSCTNMVSHRSTSTITGHLYVPFSRSSGDFRLP